MDTSKVIDKLKSIGQEVLKNPVDLKNVYTKSQDTINNGEKSGFTAEQIDNARTMVNLLRDYLQGDYKNVSRTTIAIIVGSLVYAIYPADLIPDTIPILGLVDDAAVISLTVGYIVADLICYRNWKHEVNGENTELGEYLDKVCGDNEEARKAEIQRLAAMYDAGEYSNDVEKAYHVLKEKLDGQSTDIRV